MRVRSQTFAKKNDSNAYFSEFLDANGRKIDLDHEIDVQMGVKRLFKPEFVIFICLLVRLNLEEKRHKDQNILRKVHVLICRNMCRNFSESLRKFESLYITGDCCK